MPVPREGYAMAQLVEVLRYQSEGRRFDWHNPSGRTMSLELTQPLTEMSTRNISWGIKVAGVWGWQPYHLHVPSVLKSGSLNLLEAFRPVQARNGTALPLPFMPVPRVTWNLHDWQNHSRFPLIIFISANYYVTFIQETSHAASIHVPNTEYKKALRNSLLSNVFILILSFHPHLVLQSILSPSDFPTTNLYATPPPAHFISID